MIDKNVENQKIAGKYLLELLGEEKEEIGKSALFSRLSLINKQELLEIYSKFTNNSEITNVKKLKKSDIIQKIIEEVDKGSLRELFKESEELRKIFALHPLDLQEILNCTKTERLRWTKEGKLSVVGYKSFKYGDYPVFDWLETIRLSQSEKLENWRKEYEEQKALHRSQAARKAAKTKLEKSVTVSRFEVKERKKLWQLQEENLADFFEIAYWGFAARRQAIVFTEKAKRAISKTEEYQKIQNDLNDLFQQTLKILVAAPTVEIFFVTSKNISLITWSKEAWKPTDKYPQNLPGYFVVKIENTSQSDLFYFFVSPNQAKQIFPPRHCLKVQKISRIFVKEGEFYYLEGEPFIYKLPTPKAICTTIPKLIEKFDPIEIEKQSVKNFHQALSQAEEQQRDIEIQLKENILTVTRNFEQDLEKARTRWNSLGKEIANYFELAYWTKLINQAAKTFQEKGYQQKSQEFYQLKNQGIAILNTYPLVKLTFYRPYNAERVHYNHSDWEDWEDILAEDEFEQIVTREKDYYSLFSTVICHPKIPDIFQFHTPFSLGQDIFPPADVLEAENHSQNESMGKFRFGRPLSEEEMIAIGCDQIQESFARAVQLFDLKKINEIRREKIKTITLEYEAKQKRLKELQSLKVIIDTGNVEEVTFVKNILNEQISQGKSINQARKFLLSKLCEIATIAPHQRQVKFYPEFHPKFIKKSLEKIWNRKRIQNILSQST